MLRALTLVTALVAASLAGCLTPPKDEAGDEVERAAVLPPATSGKMTKGEPSDTTTDDVCLLDGGISFPQGPELYCAKRTFRVEGELTLDALPILLQSGSGDVAFATGEAGEWALETVLRAKGASPEAARDEVAGIELGVEIGAPGAHTLVLTLPLDSEEDASYSMTSLVTLPAATLYDLNAMVGSGDLSLSGLRTRTTSLSTGSGDIAVDDWLAESFVMNGGSGDATIDADVRSVVLRLGSGDITAMLTPYATGEMVVDTGSGDVTLSLPETDDIGYDILVRTGSGDATIEMEDGRVSSSDDGEASFRTDGFERRVVRTSVQVSTGSGDAAIKSA